MRTFGAEFLNTVHGAPHSQTEFHAEIFFLLNKFRAGKADNENTLACMTRRELMSLADIIFYQAEYVVEGPVENKTCRGVVEDYEEDSRHYVNLKLFPKAVSL